jgi:hypothetical protein
MEKIYLSSFVMEIFRVVNRNPKMWFNTSCYAAPALNTLGNGGWNNLTGPGYTDQDAGLFRTFEIAERLKLQFRAEAFNLTNSPNFARPDSTLEDPTFGQVLSSLNGREIQFGLKLGW